MRLYKGIICQHRDSISGEELLQILNKVAPWDMEYDGKLKTI